MDFRITILYGSETGTAQDTAEQIWKNVKRLGLRCSVSAMDEYEIENLVTETLTIFVVATTGQGDPPRNMTKFWRFLLRKSLPANSLTNLRYAVLGLGDSSYEKYNFAAKKLNRRLAQLGGVEILSIGLADDQHDLGIDATVIPWSENLFRAITHEFKVPVNHEDDAREKFIERFRVTTVVNDVKTATSREKNRDIGRSELCINDDLLVGRIITNIRTTDEKHFQDVRLIKLQADNVNYSPGDIMYVRARNSSSRVQGFFDLLKEHDVKLSRDTLVRVEELEIRVPHALRQILSLEEIAEQYWDLSGRPRRSTMGILASISDDDLEREKLHEFTLPSGQEELYSYVNRPRRNIVEVLRDFPHTLRKIDLSVLFEIMSPIKPRAFSIASSIAWTKNEIDLLVAVVRYRTKLVDERLGLCSNWLATLRPNDEILFTIQRGTFAFDVTKPMILVAPGTGIAPFRSLLLERHSRNDDLSETLLFFGCRNENMDYHCRDDLEEIARNTGLKIHCAFSRDQEDKIYVQHVIRKNRPLCWELLDKGGKIYVSGSSKNMPKCVRDEFVDMARELGQFDDDNEAESFVKMLEKNGRYQTETWG